MAWTLEQVYETVVKEHASDIIFAAGTPAVVWTYGIMRRLEGDRLLPADILNLFDPAMTAEQKQKLETTGDLDFSIGKEGVGRFRINIHRQRGSLGAAIRFIPRDVPAFTALKLPQRVLGFSDLPFGLVLVTGGAGTGKSTTLASMIDHINHSYAYHVITMEDPIEYMFRHDKSIIEQREIGSDCPTFASALRHVVRQKPDVILVGEMRDLETISAALTAAETGHLVLASLHTINAVDTVNRIVDVFPPGQQAQVRVQLAETLQGVVCQTLFHDELDGGMAPASEIMVVTPAMRRAIRDGETHLLQGMIETGRSMGMQTMDYSIAELVKAKRVSPAFALSRAHNPEKLGKLIAA
jgi:twitching motility protein PilT